MSASTSNPYAPQWRVVCNDFECGWTHEDFNKGRAINAGQVHTDLKHHYVSDVQRITR